MRGRAEVAYQGHSLGVAGSTPAPAIETTPASVFYTFVHGTKNNISEALGHERNPETFGVF